MSSSSAQQEQLPSARFKFVLKHNSSSSTTAWRGGRWTVRNVLLRVCVHFTHQRLSHYTALLSGPHRIGTEAALTDHGKFPGGEREKLWREFFKDPSQWWDHRSEKTDTRFPDFKHKTTQKALWLDHRQNPPWVAVEIAAMAPGTVQLNIFA
ncbi:unnamed protein product [Sphagnum troendelagicum]|uniref:Uncharacterized protein n=1 Tax=Sphagnum troendelagicum TaxID=128251 RepID=A0ABP0UMF0_9BRYO